MASTEWKESILPGEAEELERHAQMLGAMQRELGGESPTRRALHAKQHAGVTARLEVLADLPEELAQGLFAKPGTYDAYVRFSNGANRVQPDELPDIRGFALKVLGLEGKKIIPGLEDAKTQDFLFIQTPVSPFRTVDEFVTFVRASAGSRALLLPRLVFSLGPLGTLGVLRNLVKRVGPRVKSFSEQRFYTAAPIQWGPYAAKVALFPASHGPGEEARGPSGFARDVTSHLASGDLVYELRAQLFVDDAKTPIEDASVEWPEDVAPFRVVARLVIPKQDVGSARGREIGEYVESLVFDPWHALVAHKPLGIVMRARNAAYRVSSSQRRGKSELDVKTL